jgi:GNAT superfamily N-acetyltransferase
MSSRETTSPPKLKVNVSPLKASEVEEASRIVRLAFGTFLRMPNPHEFMGDRDFLGPRFGSKHVKILAARADGRLIGSNAVTRWGAFGFFGPLTVLPEYWDRGVAQHLLEATMKTFEAWGLRHTGLFTFPYSPKHLGLYQKFGYWPRYLTAIMTRQPEKGLKQPVLLSALPRPLRAKAMEACARLTHKIDRGLDLTEEIRTAIARRIGDAVLSYTRGSLDGFAVCMHGPGSEGGEKICYIKFAAARDGARFSALLESCDAYAAVRGVNIEAGVSLARQDAFRRMRAHGYQAVVQGVAMQRPNAEGFNRADAYVIDDWR